MIKLGMRSEVLSSKYIWYCATCHTCEERCPRGLGFFNVLNVLKNIAAKEGFAPSSWIEQTKQITLTGISIPTQETWIKKREELSLRPLRKKISEKAAKLIDSTFLIKQLFKNRVVFTSYLIKKFRYETLLLCCGGKTFPNSQDLAHSLIGIKLENLKNKKVDCIILHCQSCYLMYGTQQEKVSEKSGKQYNIPILLYPQLLGLALGGDPIADLGLNLNLPYTDKLLDKIGIGHNKKMVKFEIQKVPEWLHDTFLEQQGIELL